MTPRPVRKAKRGNTELRTAKVEQPGVKSELERVSAIQVRLMSRRVAIPQRTRDAKVDWLFRRRMSPTRLFSARLNVAILAVAFNIREGHRRKRPGSRIKCNLFREPRASAADLGSLDF